MAEWMVAAMVDRSVDTTDELMAVMKVGATVGCSVDATAGMTDVN